jgi:hypothetical protein
MVEVYHHRAAMALPKTRTIATAVVEGNAPRPWEEDVDMDFSFSSTVSMLLEEELVLRERWDALIVL